ncbi:NUDIX domain-containing protein [Streptomyces profundus]|uniref:NUDIX domain-containing protein n=1 Tax=Streptomyces profundus TaxID=2867410 RepID=UPI001D165596|nr:NUDIX hydrolase [Streptomyces sp. MA3_2.13]UED86569.1 NUDIX hydrolase [Streptomyces sp. MA3_2.13]
MTITTILRSPVPIVFHVLATTRSRHVLMVRDEEHGGWMLPAGVAAPGRCLILTARQTLWEATGYDRAVSEALAVSLDTDAGGTLNAVSYVLDGGETADVPRHPHHLPPDAAWLPTRELTHPPALVHRALIAAAQQRKLPLLINADRPEAAYT